MRLLPTWLSPRRWLNPRAHWTSYDKARPLPPGAREYLRPDNPRLLELRRRYAACRLPVVEHSQWSAEYLERELKLTHFRGDNAYVWQFRNVGEAANAKYRAYLDYLAGIDRQGLLQRLGEDGLFGCWTFDYPGWPPVSRDLLDAVNELSFLNRHIQLLERAGMTVLDIGAGYGRLAWRALEAAPQLGAYLCADAVAESTFLCEFHLRFRGSRAEVIPIDELDERLAGRKIDLAVCVHAFSEMTLKTIDGWIARLAALEVPHLFIVDHPSLVSRERDGTAQDFEREVLTTYGYRLATKDTIVPPALGEFMNVRDCFYLFARGRPDS